MAWSAAKFGDVTKANGLASVVVVFVNDETNETFMRTLSIDGNQDNLKRQVQAEIDRANAVTIQLAAIAKGIVIDTKPVEQDVGPLDQFTKDYVILSRLKRAVDAGVIPPDHKGYQAMLAKVQGEWVDGYELQAMI